MSDFSKIPWIASHIELYKTDPEKAHMWDSSELGGPGILPTLLLTTIGRRSRVPRSTPLIYGQHGESYTVIASKGGNDKHPAWFLNLQEDPNCTLMVGTKPLSAYAYIAQGEERTAIWHRMSEIYPPYIDYQNATERTIPVVVLTPQ